MVCDFKPLRSFDEVAKIMTKNGDSITPPGVRCIEKRALKKLKNELLKNGITSINDLISPQKSEWDDVFSPSNVFGNHD